jgi:hypothetical protein
MSSAGAASLAALSPARAAASRRKWCEVARPQNPPGQGALGAQAATVAIEGAKKSTNEPDHVQEKQWFRDLSEVRA